MAQLAVPRPFTVVCDTDDRDEWLSHRASSIGASEIAAVLGESPWLSPLALWAIKAGRFQRDLSDNEAVWWGNKLEAPIIEAYSERTGRQTRKAGVLLRSVEHPWATCTLDGETWLTANDNPWPLEIKNTSSFKSDDWENGPPPHYELQCQQQMLVTGATKATIAALIGGQRMVWADVPRNETEIRRIVFHGSRFWERIQRGDMPEPDGTESSKRALAALYPDGEGIKVLPATVINDADELEQAKSEVARLKKRIDAIENGVRAALGESEVGVLSDGRSFVWRNQKRASYTVPECEFRVLRLKQPRDR